MRRSRHEISFEQMRRSPHTTICPIPTRVRYSTLIVRTRVPIPLATSLTLTAQSPRRSRPLAHRQLLPGPRWVDLGCHEKKQNSRTGPLCATRRLCGERWLQHGPSISHEWALTHLSAVCLNAVSTCTRHLMTLSDNNKVP